MQRRPSRSYTARRVGREMVLAGGLLVWGAAGGLGRWGLAERSGLAGALASIGSALLIIFVAAAVITPSGDMITQTIFAAPMIGLYLLGIVIAWFVAPRT